jgi:cytochrome c1
MIMKFHYWNCLPSKNKYIKYFIQHEFGCLFEKVKTQEAQTQVIKYLEEIGDSKKEQREELGPKFLIYLVVFAIFAFLWKASRWRDVH